MDCTKTLPLLGALLLSFGSIAEAQGNKSPKLLPPVYQNEAGGLSYTLDEQGNRIPDFSYCGYRAGEQAIPAVDVKVTVAARKGNATRRIQAALDYVAALPVGTDGFRGAVLLEKGLFEVGGSLYMQASGVVLRGLGTGPNGTTLIGTGDSRETLITVRGKNDKIVADPQKITNPYVPVNAFSIQVPEKERFKVGDKVVIRRPSTLKWIQTIGADHFGGGVTALGWKPNQRDIVWDRTIKAIDEQGLWLDAPLTTALDSSFGGGTVASCTWKGRLARVGIENLQLISAYDPSNPKDEAHRWVAISLENVTDAWVRQVNFKHFAGSAVFAQSTAQRVTVEDCISTEPVSEIGGQRRYTFFTTGQQTLFQRLYASDGYHDFGVGYCAAGPNAFVQCESSRPHSYSGTVDSWASGVLFDMVNVDGQALRFADLGQDGQGAGWTAANSVFWQCVAARVECARPPTAQNWAFGTWAQFAGNGYWGMSNEHIKPRSLYYAQLKQRLGNQLEDRAILLPMETEASSSPKVEVAMSLTQNAARPMTTLLNFIQKASERQAVPTFSNAPEIDKIGIPALAPTAKAVPMKLQHGRLLRGDTVMVGNRQEVSWWSGSSRPHGVLNAKPHITRFVPGQTGTGLTDDLDELTHQMRQDHIRVLDHNYGLWYDRRRDDHERIRRMDGEVWPPFYELPFARSGKETAWDGLSKYDLTKYNKWYWNRLKQFADLADRRNLVLIHQHYFQHNIIEAGAHYSDFPWRTANNINNVGFPEPVPYAGDKRIFMAEQFYDITHPVRRKIHRDYIRQCLNNFAENTSVIQLVSAEYTGPLSFVQFWLDVIQEWETEKKKNVIVGLSTTKDVQDAILADAVRSKAVDVIDIRYWHIQANGAVYEPKGGQNLAPRQHARLMNPKRSSFEQIYRAVREYRQKYPQKAVIYNADGYEANGWAVLMAGGSLPNVPQHLPPQLLKDMASMKIIELPGKPAGQWALAQEGKSYLIYQKSNEAITLDLREVQGTFTVHYLNPENGQLLLPILETEGGKIISLNEKSTGAVVVWMQKKYNDR